MSNPIRFFITMNGINIRSIQELKQNFHAHDMLTLYREGVLKRWLIVHGGAAEAEKLDRIDERSNSSILRGLWSIFGDGNSEAALNDAIHYFDFLDSHRFALASYQNMLEQEKEIIDNYHQEYERAKQILLNNGFDMHLARSEVDKIANRYIKLFEIDYLEFTETFLKHVPTVILLLFANIHIRAWLVDNDKFQSLARQVGKKFPGPDNNQFLLPFWGDEFKDHEHYSKVKSLIRTTRQYTHESWDEIEADASKQFMLLVVPMSSKARDYSTKKVFLPGETVYEFPIVNGLEFNSHPGTGALVYMEV